MSRVEPKERPAKREAQEGRRQSGERIERSRARPRSKSATSMNRCGIRIAAVEETDDRAIAHHILGCMVRSRITSL